MKQKVDAKQLNKIVKLLIKLTNIYDKAKRKREGKWGK